MAELYVLPEKGVCIVHRRDDFMIVSSGNEDTKYKIMGTDVIEEFNEWLKQNGIDFQNLEPNQVRYCLLAFKEHLR